MSRHTDTLQHVGARMAAARKAQKLTLKAVARPVGVTEACVCRWEKGQSFPRHHSLVKLARVLKVSVDDLISEGREVAKQSDPILQARERVAKALGVSVGNVSILVEGRRTTRVRTARTTQVS